tara:strand:+ start:1954 stop:2073 length:120 start_codon:yes stop_codon:yes gene_type:complete
MTKPEPFNMKEKIILGIFIAIAGCFYKIKKLLDKEHGDE